MYRLFNSENVHFATSAQRQIDSSPFRFLTRRLRRSPHGPIRSDGPGSNHLSVHLLHRLLSFLFRSEGNEPIALWLLGVHVFDDLAIPVGTE